MKRFALITAAVAFFLSGCGSDDEICGGRVQIHSKGRIKFSKNERPLLCGDPDVKEWHEIPLAQTETALKEFLKGRGYFDSKFELKDKKLHVYTGKVYKVKKVVFVGAPEDFERLKYIGWQKQDFTGDTLNDIENYTMRRLKQLGYACAEVKTQAIIETQVVEVHINPGKRYTFPKIEYDPPPSAKPELLERYFAFNEGEVFNEDLLTLSSRRIEADAVVSKSNFLTTCEENGELTINHRVSEGPTHLLQFGAGVSTEEIPIFKAGWKDSKVGGNGSILSADLYASHLRQVLLLGYEWHAFEVDRLFLKPTIEARRVDEEDQEYYNFVGWLPFGGKFDPQPTHLEFYSGPAGIFENTQEGPSTGQKEFAVWKSSFSINTHNYEVFMNDPRRGGRISLETSSVGWSSVKNVNAHWISLTGVKLWNLLNYGPPKYVFGVRFGLDSVMTTKDYDVTNYIPQSYFTWLGGDSSVRGFDRRELPRDALGALSSFYMGSEVRFASLFMKGLDPFVFTDIGLIGDSNVKLSGPLYWAPGFGLRYQSIIGVIRGTLAHGFVAGENDPDHEHYQYFVSLGREF